MKLALAENISKMRKERGMTQEQLAEALGLSFASVSKWERGAARPELNTLMEMAAVFGVSLDALLGFEMHSKSVETLEERIHSLQMQKNYSEAASEAEKALLRFPNDFRIVYRSGTMYALAGFERKKDEYLRRGIELLEHAVLLLSQNTKPEINEVSIQSDIAQCHINLGNYDKGIEILKKYNVGGVNNALLAMMYSGTEGLDHREAEAFLMDSFGSIISSTVSTMLAYGNYYLKNESYALSREALCWLVGFLESIKTDVNAVAYTDKIIALCHCECARLSYMLGEEDAVEPYLRRAYELAKAFDKAPAYSVSNIKFCVGEFDKATAYDNMGETALGSVEKQLAQEEESEVLLKMWERIKKV